MKIKTKSDLFRGRDRSVWKFWRDGVSSSLLAKFLSCREQARLQLVDGLRTRSEPIYLGFGTCGHWMLYRMYTRSKPPSAKLIRKWLDEYAALWLKEVPRPTSAMREQQDHIYALLTRLLPAYADRWAGDWPNQKYPLPNKTVRPVTWRKLEHGFQTNWQYTDGLTVPIRGTKDAVFGDKHDADWVFDTKFLSVIVPGDLEETMEWNLQFMLYLWAHNEVTKKMPRGFLLNVCRRPTHWMGKNENAPEFYARVAKEIVDKPDHFFQRYELRVTKDDISRYVRAVLAPLMDDIRAWWEGSAPHYMNPNALISKYGRCEMFGPITTGDTSHTYKIKDVYGYTTSLFGG